MRVSFFLLLFALGIGSMRAQRFARWQVHLAGHEATDVVEGNGVTWIGTNRGVVRLDRTSGEKRFFDLGNSGLPGLPVYSVSLDSSGNLWVTYGKNYIRTGIARYDGATWKVYRAGRDGLLLGNAYDVAVTPDGAIVTTVYGRVHRLEPEYWMPVETTFLQPGAHQLAVDAAGRLWAAFSGYGVARLDDDRWTIFNDTNAGLPNRQVIGIAPDRDDGLWVSTSEGIVKISESGSRVFRSGERLPDGHIAPIAVDHDGVAWSVVDYSIVRIENDEVQLLMRPSGMGMANEVNMVTPAADGGLWFAMRDGAYHYRDGAITRFTTSSTPIPSDEASAIAVDPRGTVWFVIERDLVRYDDGVWTTIDRSDHGLTSPADIIVDRIGRVWAASEHRVAMFDGSTWTTMDAAEPSVLRAESMTVDQRGHVWVVGGTVYEFDGATWKRHPEFSRRNDSLAMGIAADSNGGVWVGMFNGRVGRFDGASWTWHEPLDHWISDIATDSAGVVWIASSQALARFDGSTWTMMRREDGTLPYGFIHRLIAAPGRGLWFAFTESSGDGVGAGIYNAGRWSALSTSNTPMPEPNVRAIARGLDGSIWLGTRSGIMHGMPGAVTSVDMPARGVAGSARISARPNPTVGDVTIDLDLAAGAHVTLSLHDGLGRRVATLLDAPLERGPHSIDAALDGVPAGIYHCRMLVDGDVHGAMIILRR